MDFIIKLKLNDHYITFSWWSELWGDEMVYYGPNPAVYHTEGSTCFTTPPPTKMEVLRSHHRGEGIASLFSSRRVTRDCY